MGIHSAGITKPLCGTHNLPQITPPALCPTIPLQKSWPTVQAEWMICFYLIALNNFQLSTLVQSPIPASVTCDCPSPLRLWAGDRVKTMSDSSLGTLHLAQGLAWGKYSINVNEWMKTPEVILPLNCFSWTLISRLSSLGHCQEVEKPKRKKRSMTNVIQATENRF